MTPLSALTVTAPEDAPPSAAQQRFDALRAKVAQGHARLQQVQAFAQAHRAPHLQAMHRVAKQAVVQQKELLFALHARLHSDSGPEGAALTAQHQRFARRAIGQCLAALLPSDDPQVQAVAECHADPQAEQERAQALLAQAQALCQELQALLGQPIEGAAHCRTPDEVMAAASRQWHRQQDKDDARKAAKRSQRAQRSAQAGRSKRDSEQGNGQGKGQGQETAPPPVAPQQALRTLYRQLASALHPDREPDADLRARKTQWMAQANAAYEKHDLTALLALQMAHLAQPPVASAGPADAQQHAQTLQAMGVLLQAQVVAIEADVAQLCAVLSHELGVPVSAQTQPPDWVRALAQQLADAQHGADALQRDVAQVQSDAQLLRWLKAHDRQWKTQTREAE